MTYGNCVELAEDVAAKLQGEVDIEIVDLRSLVPCDYETITESVKKTGRMVVFYEDNRTCSFGKAIVSEKISRRERWTITVRCSDPTSRQTS